MNIIRTGAYYKVGENHHSDFTLVSSFVGVLHCDEEYSDYIGVYDFNSQKFLLIPTTLIENELYTYHVEIDVYDNIEVGERKISYALCNEVGNHFTITEVFEGYEAFSYLRNLSD